MANFDLTGYSRLWRDRQSRFARVLDGSRQTLAEQAEQLSRQMMERLIYSIPETVSSSGRPLWTRTRNLINNENGIVRSAEVILTNSVVYARARHELGRDGRKTDRPAHWRDEIRAGLRRLQLAITEQRLLAWLRE